MSKNHKSCSRRDFLIKTAAGAAGSLIGTCPLVSALAQPQIKTSDTVPAHARLAIIIDDVGYNATRVLPFLELGVPITFSILPRLRYSARLAEKLHSAGHEIMLHQPMEPCNQLIDPGPGALYLSHKADEICTIIEENLSSFPFTAGVNNHMGSRFTESREKTQDALTVFRERSLFFIDSFTSRNSIAFDTARDLDMIAGFRDVFIDNRVDKDYICLQLQKLKKYALNYGYAIGIGHPRPETVSALAEFLDGLDDSCCSIVNASEVVYTQQATT